MKVLLKAAIEICLLKRGPQDLPASVYLLWLAILLNMLAGVLTLMGSQMMFGYAIGQTLFELMLMLGMLYTALQIKKRVNRYTQAATALMLSGFLLGMLLLPLITWGSQTQSAVFGLLFLALFSWGIVVFGHILRHTFDFSLNVGIAAALLYTLIAATLVAIFFPVVS